MCYRAGTAQRETGLCLVNESDVARILRAADADKVLPWRQQDLTGCLREVGGIHVCRVRPVGQLLEVRGIVAEVHRELPLVAELLESLAETASRQESKQSDAAERSTTCWQLASIRSVDLVIRWAWKTCSLLQVLPVYGRRQFSDIGGDL